MVRNVIGYCRVSTAEQGASGLGLDAQEAAIRLACQQREWPEPEIVREVGSGASWDTRKLAAIVDGMDSEYALVAAKLDRVTRSVIHAGHLMEAVRKQGFALVLLDLGVDTSTAGGQLVANVVAAVAEFERLAIGERTRDALAAKKARGEKVGRERVIGPEPERIVKDLWKQGYTLNEIGAVLTDMGHHPPQSERWRHTSLIRLRDRTITVPVAASAR